MVKRYRKGRGAGSMVESETGIYVMHSEYAALEQLLRDALEDDQVGGGLTGVTRARIADVLDSTAQRDSK